MIININKTISDLVIVGFFQFQVLKRKVKFILMNFIQSIDI